MYDLTKIACVFVLFLGHAGVAQHDRLEFTPVTIDDGLSQNAVNTIHQDRSGFLWFGTQDGLNRFDGYDFTVYRHQPGVDNSLPNNYVWDIHEDSSGILWIGTFGGGLTRFDPATETFTSFTREPDNPKSISHDHVFSIVEHPAGTLWLGTDDGICKFDTRTGEATRYFQSPGNTEGLPSSHFGALTFQPPHTIWARTNGSLARFDIATGKVVHFTSDPLGGTIPIGAVSSIHSRGDSVWLTCGAGVLACDFKQMKTHVVASRESLGNGFPSTLLFDPAGLLWIGTDKGLASLDLRNQSIVRFVDEPDNPTSLVSDIVISIFRSRDGVLWIGTRGGGISKLEKVKQDFLLMRHDPDDPGSLNHRAVGPVLEDSRGILWIGTPNGLNAYKRHGDALTRLVLPNRQQFRLYVLSLGEDQKGRLWVGSRTGGVHVLTFPDGDNLSRLQIASYTQDDDKGLLSNAIQVIFEDSHGAMLLGTGGGGLSILEEDIQHFTTYGHRTDGTGPSHPYIFSILEDSFGNYWVGTATGGLNLFDRQTNRFHYIKRHEDNALSLSNNLVLSIFEDSKKRLWVGTASGLNKLAVPLTRDMFGRLQSGELRTDSLFVSYGRSEGLPNDVIYGILEDRSANLWLSTNKGIVLFSPDLTEPVLKAFDVTDGLQNNEFNQNAYFRDASGRMYFGGVDGLNIFHPDSIRGNPYVPPVVVTDFKLFNETVPVYPDGKPGIFTIAKAIPHTAELQIHYDHDVISFGFAALSFINTFKNQYAYMMEGFDRDWIPAGTKRSVTYTNLDPGTYVFRVKGSNNDGVWNEEGVAIALIIPPPPWLSWYAYLLYSAVLVMSLVLFVKHRVKVATREVEAQARIEIAKAEERERVRKQSAADFHDEAGHKLTKIALFTELARHEGQDSPSLREYLSRIEEHTKELSSGMRDFIWVLDPTKETLLDTMHRLEHFGNSMFEHSETRFSLKGIHPDTKSVVLSMDCRRGLMLIFKEAMNNCLKYSRARTVELTVQHTDGTIAIMLTDDGTGFDLRTASDGYGMRTMKERADKLGAELSVYSTPGKGTSVCFRGSDHSLTTQSKGKS